MLPEIKLTNNVKQDQNIIFLGKEVSVFSDIEIYSDEFQYFKDKIESGDKRVLINKYSKHIFLQIIAEGKDINHQKENARKEASTFQKSLNNLKIDDITLYNLNLEPSVFLAFIEGLVLSNYQFIKYLISPVEKEYSLKTVHVYHQNISKEGLSIILNVCRAVYKARDLVNEPVNHLNAARLSEEIVKMCTEGGIKYEVFEKKKIESLRMGGIISVNKGSIDPPTFTVMEWKPGDAINDEPYILVGKGIVYDTGGLSLKKTANSMDTMKSDMAGAAIAACTIYALAVSKIPVYIIGLIPATDNRPDGNAYAPGDIIKMYNGMSVEIKNTDAEGRLILADGLSYAEKYHPKLIFSIATLTGSAIMATGDQASVAMGNAGEEEMAALKKSGNDTFERIAEMPFWDEYAESLKSDIADLKNLGGKYAGAITAGKFLENFTSFPFIHLDIAGTSFLENRDHYRSKGATGTGIRLLYQYFMNKTI